jgi:hypothetical protein
MRIDRGRAAKQKPDFLSKRVWNGFFSPPLVSDLISTTNSEYRLNLKNGKHIVVNQSCASVHQALPRE